MDSGTIIISIVTLLICIIPIIILNINSRKRKKEHLKWFFNLAEKNNCSITLHELWGNSAIGIDEKANILFFAAKADDNESLQQVNLAEIQNCRVINTTRTVSHKDGNYKIVEKLELAFTYHDKGKTETIFHFYNADYNRITFTGNLQSVEKWSKIINDHIPPITQIQK